MKEILNIIVAALLVVAVYLSFKSAAAIQAVNNRLDRAQSEYQIVVEDSMLQVFDGNNHIGTVKLQGQLDSLLVDYNQ